MAVNRTNEVKVSHRVDEGRAKLLSVREEIDMFDGMVVPMMLYGCEVWALFKQVWKRVDVLEMKCFRIIYGTRRMNQSKNN